MSVGVCTCEQICIWGSVWVAGVSVGKCGSVYMWESV